MNKEILDLVKHILILIVDLVCVEVELLTVIYAAEFLFA